jgi:hypothetical protein
MPKSTGQWNNRPNRVYLTAAIHHAIFKKILLVALTAASERSCSPIAKHDLGSKRGPVEHETMMKMVSFTKNERSVEAAQVVAVGAM